MSVTSLAERAYLELRDRLVMLDIEPGAPISETELALELGVGRTPLREALKRLETDHLVQSFSRRGTFATPAELSELRDITEVRVVLEPVAARRVAEQASDADRAELRALALGVDALLETEPKPRDLLEHDLQIHRAIYSRVDNEHLRETLLRLDHLATRLWWSVIRQSPSAADHIAGHRALLLAIADGDGEEAAELARTHVEQFHRQLQEFILSPSRV